MNRSSEPILSVRGLAKQYPITGGTIIKRTVGKVRAVDGVDLDLYAGETLGLVGESGCGKSTITRTLLRLDEPSAGEAFYRQKDIFKLLPAELRALRRNIQVVFQDPYGSLNPRLSIRQIISEPWQVHRDLVAPDDREARVEELVQQVGLRQDLLDRYPHQLSGGQRQRVGIARALALEPQILICDEPVSALDVSVQAQIMNLLESVQEQLRLSYLFIAHDLSVVRHISDRVAVMYLGRIVEIGDADDIYEHATHPYTQALLSAVPEIRRQRSRSRIVLSGELPSPTEERVGCSFRSRCWKAQPKCAEAVPELKDRLGIGHPSACFYPELPATPPTNPDKMKGNHA